MKHIQINNWLFAVMLGILTFGACKKEEDKDDPKTPVEQNPVDTGTAEVKEQIIEIQTSFGSMYMWLYKETPLHRANFLKLADTGYFDGTTFHRIVKTFVIQGGDPNSRDDDPDNDGEGGPDYTLPAEIRDTIKHVRGAVGAARTGDDVNPERESNASQFYICLSTGNTAQLNKKYTVFGFIMKGMNIADSVVKQPNDPANNRPFTDIKMQVKILEKTIPEIKAEYNYTPPGH